MNYLLLNVGLALFWAALTGSFAPANLVVGFITGYAMLFISRRAVGPTMYFTKTRQFASFILVFTKDLVVSNVRVAADVLTPSFQMKPRIIAFPLDAKTDSEIGVVVNLISLTPGTLILDVSSDRKLLFIHVMNAPDVQTVITEIKEGVEKRVLLLMRGMPTAPES